jgi:hypothetical protein
VLNRIFSQDENSNVGFLVRRRERSLRYMYRRVSEETFYAIGEE